MLALPFVCTFAGLALIALTGKRRPGAAPWIGAAAALAAAVVLLIAWLRGSRASLEIALAGPLEPLAFALDPLGAMLATLAAALAALVLVYTSAYLPHHLREHGRSLVEQRRFSALILAFLTAMLALALARDVIALFLALELTALASFLLIAFDREEEEARRAALAALLLTAGTALLFLVGALVIANAAGGTGLGDLRLWVAEGGRAPAAATCIALALLAKSAQVPLHMWLPRAMVAPTPVSAYLHSAALVATGAFVLQRLWFLFEPIEWMPTAIYGVGLASILVGSALALAADRLKRLLAYSTIAQYGYVLALLASGGDAALAGAPLYLFAHGLAKCALFLTAGAVTQTTGASRLSESGGLLRSMPVLAAASAVAAAGLAGLPLTIGYAKDELWLKAAEHLGPGAAVLAAAAAALTLAYTARFWAGIFLGARRDTGSPPRALVAPVVALGVPIVVFGVWFGPLEALAAGAGAEIAGRTVGVHLRYAPTVTAALAAGAWIAGGLLFATRRRWQQPFAALCQRIAHGVGPARRLDQLGRLLLRLGDRLHDVEVRDLRDRIGAVFVPLAILILLGWLAEPWSGWHVDPIELDDVPLAMALVATVVAAFAAARARTLTEVFLSLAFAGYGLALVFAFSAAPDVALVAVIVETLLTLLALTTLRRVRPRLLQQVLGRRPRRRRDLWVAVGAGLAAAALSMRTLQPTPAAPVADDHIRLADDAHAEDVVAAILSDFRGLDTAGEITVLVIAVFGAVVLARARGTTR